MRRLALVAALLAPAAAHARPTAQPLELREHQVALEVGAAPALGVELSYGRRFRRVLGRSAITPAVGFGFPLATVADGRTYDVEVGASWVAPLYRGLGVTGSAALTLASARNPNADLVGLGVDLSLAPGWYADTWFVAAELGWAPTCALHIRHSDAAKDAFSGRYPDGDAGGGPRDGWYRGTAHRLRAGLSAGVVIRRRVSLYAGGGFAHAVNGLGIVAFPDVGVLPFFARLGVAVGF